MLGTENFLAAARCFADLVARIPPERLADRGLGEWDVRSLLGHTSRALITVETYLARPVPTVRMCGAAGYYAAVASAGVDATAILARGIQAGHDLGSDPAASVETLIARVTVALADVDATRLVDTLVGGMRVDEYLRTRTFELAVHTLDLAVAAGVECELPLAVQLDAAGLAAETSVASGSGPRLLFALTGRAPLPVGFSMLG